MASEEILTIVLEQKWTHWVQTETNVSGVLNSDSQSETKKCRMQFLDVLIWKRGSRRYAAYEPAALRNGTL